MAKNNKRPHSVDIAGDIFSPAVLLHTAILLSLLFAPEAQAYFQDAAYGARPAGMGEAFVSVADDINAVLFNPAGLAQLPGVEVMGMYAGLYSELDTRLYTGEKDSSGYHFLAAASPWPLIQGGLFAYWLRYASLLYAENTFALGYGRRLLPVKVWPQGVALDGGISIKLLQWSVAANEYTSDNWLFPERQKIGVSLDLGLRAVLFDDFYLGFAVDNIIPPDMGLTVREYVPSVFRLGVAYHLRFPGAYIEDFLTQCEMTARDNIYTAKLGMESWLIRRIFALRAGISTDSVTSGLSLRYGLPGRPLAVQLDYAFSYPFYLADTWGSHRLSLSASWKIDAPLPAEASILPPAAPTPVPAAAADVGQDPDYEKFLKFLQFQKYRE
ncbi:hypothetical protein JW933_12005, partial [candidate division FCPU426 bacterium]|nr:hypothetical protein [candidate division FCPU426 bacterium]